ncbi:hypothetical protein Ancab_029771 [Ancistrocladus abbreviatus]
MLPVCSATSCCSHQVPLNDKGWNFSQCEKALKVRCIAGDNIMSGLSIGIQVPRLSCATRAMNSLYSGLIERPKPFYGSEDCSKYIQKTMALAFEKDAVNLTDNLAGNADILLQRTDGETIPGDLFSDGPAAVPDTLSTSTDSLPNLKNNIENFLSGMNESIGTSVNEQGSALNSSIDRIKSSITSTVEGTNEAVDKLTSQVLSSMDQAGELARNKLLSLSGDLRETSGKAGVLALDLLRQTIIAVQDSLGKGTRFVSYSYGSIKELLPPVVQNVLNLTEERTTEIFKPIEMALQQVYAAVEGLEASLGLDPSDPVISFVLLVGTSSTIWVVYWLVTYSGYAGDLSPDLALELLSGRESSVLIDVRPEDLRERDGIPDVRRAARFRYANVSIPEVDGSTRKLLKSGKDLDDTLTAVVIRNLKNVGDRSNIIIMDADGSRSKGIARSLRKLGMKRSYRVRGGFQSWVKQGLRIKELRPETALTILNEEAEAILEDLRPSPVQLFGITMGSVAALYVLLEWEKTLQLIGVIGLGQTVYRRVASYEDIEDLKSDMRWLLTPIRLGVQAFSWAAGKLETNGIGLPMSPSSSDVQSRVLQAAAKHESQPSDSEGTPDSLPDSSVSVSENVDLSEA